MTEKPFDLHDATLLSVRLEWASQTCCLDFRGSPSHPEPFHLRFEHVQELVVPIRAPWGSSVSVLELREPQPGRYELEMQSGDTLVVVAADGSSKPMPLRGPA